MSTLSGYGSITVCHIGANDSINVNDLQSCAGGRLFGFPPVTEQVTSAHPCSRNWISTVFPVTFGVSPVKQSSTTTNKIRSHHQNKTIKGGIKLQGTKYIIIDRVCRVHEHHRKKIHEVTSLSRRSQLPLHSFTIDWPAVHFHEGLPCTTLVYLPHCLLLIPINDSR